MKLFPSITESYKSFFERLITEKTHDVKRDVETLYNLYLKNVVDDLIKSDLNDIESIFEKHGNIQYGSYVFGSILSDRLLSPDSKQAHSVNPISIVFVADKRLDALGTYNPSKKQIIINLAIAYDVAKYGVGKPGHKQLNSKLKKMIINELKPEKIKGTIAHELSHWIDDSYYDSITNLTTKAKQAKEPSTAMKLGRSNVNLTYFEINSQIAAIKQFKNSIPDKDWESLTFTDLVYRLPSLMNIFNAVNNKKELEKYLKDLISRMSREKLLTNRMTKTISRQDLSVLF